MGSSLCTHYTWFDQDDPGQMVSSLILSSNIILILILQKWPPPPFLQGQLCLLFSSCEETDHWDSHRHTCAISPNWRKTYEMCWKGIKCKTVKHKKRTNLDQRHEMLAATTQDDAPWRCHHSKVVICYALVSLSPVCSRMMSVQGVPTFIIAIYSNPLEPK